MDLCSLPGLWLISHLHDPIHLLLINDHHHTHIPTIMIEHLIEHSKNRSVRQAFSQRKLCFSQPDPGCHALSSVDIVQDLIKLSTIC